MLLNILIYSHSYPLLSTQSGAETWALLELRRCVKLTCCISSLFGKVKHCSGGFLTAKYNTMQSIRLPQ